MVAKITFPKRANAALNYNENKVKEGKAECLHAANSLKAVKEMSHYDKKQLLERNHELSDAQTKTMHISLNFDPSEKLPKEKLVQLAKDYMGKIGFGDQSYIVYQHKDAGHPHIHIVTSTINSIGKKLNTHNIGRNESEKARKEIESKYNLIKAGDKQRQMVDKITPVNIQKVIYGKSETRKAIGQVVSGVLNTYTYTSLPEFNAILLKYNARAERGTETSRTYKNNGLQYHALDKNGKPLGIPIKASNLPGSPTLKRLELLFETNKAAKTAKKQQVKNVIDGILTQKIASMDEFKKILLEKGIDLVLRKNDEDRIYGATYVDHRSKVVLNGSDLGKVYSPKALETIFKSASQPEQDHNINPLPEQTAESAQPDIKKGEALTKNKKQSKNAATDITKQTLTDHNYSSTSRSVIEEVIGREKTDQYIPAELKRKRKKRKRKNLRM